MEIQVERLCILCDTCEVTVIDLVPGHIPMTEEDQAAVAAAVDQHKSSAPDRHHEIRARVEGVV